MAATITDRTPGPIVVQSGTTVKPFANVDINDPPVFSQTPPYVTGGGTGTISVALTAPHDHFPDTNLGSLSEDTMGSFTPPGTFDPATATFTDQTLVAATAPGNLTPSAILHNLQYTAPALPYATTEHVWAQIFYNPSYGAGVYDRTPVRIDVVQPPTAPAPPDPPAGTVAPPPPAAPPADPAPIATITPATIGEPVFRFYDPSNQDHFFTSDANEAAHLQAGNSGMIMEGSVFHAVDPATDANAAPVYRFYEPGNNSHFYTDDVAEMKALVASNPALLFEGAAFSAHTAMQAGDVAVVRFYEPNSDVHMYSSNAGEIANLSSRSDMIQEGIAFFAKA